MSMIGKLIDDLEDLSDSLQHSSIPDNCHSVINEAIDTIKCQSAKLVAHNLRKGWIPCSERLPVGDDYRKMFDDEWLYLSVLAQEDEGSIYIAFYDQEDDEWYDQQEFPFNPVAWQPLPEPYNGE